MSVEQGMTLLYALFVSAPQTQPMSWDEPLDIEELADCSETVVVGEVTAIWVERRDGSLWTVASVLVEETLVGEAELLLQVSWPGGQLGRTELIVSGAPELEPGDRAVFFVEEDGRVAGMTQGVLHVESEDFLWRDLSNHAFGTEIPEGPEAFTMIELRSRL